MREIALSQTYPRYYARDFERRWQKAIKHAAAADD
jgi:hypothetical protein